MRKQIIHLVLSLETGGMERFVANLVLRQHRDNDVRLLCTDRLGPMAEPLRDANIEVELYPRSAASSFVPRLSDRLRSADILHSHSGLYHPAARAARRARGTVHVTTDHGRFNPDPLKIRIADRLHLPWVDMVVAVSDELRDYLHRKVHIPARKLRTIINGVDTDRFCPVENDVERTTLRKRWGASDQTLVVGSVGRQAEVKEYTTLIRAVAAARARGTDIILVLAGDGPLLESNRAVASELDAPVHFLGEQHDIASILHAFDLFALSSRSEGTSMAILEAQASGLPVFATPVGGNPHLVRDGVHGRHLPVASVEAWADALTAASGQREQLQIWGADARARVISEFSLERAAQAYDALYEELLAAKGIEPR